MAYMRKEAQTQGVTSVKAWDCTIACYTPRFLQLAGNAAEGQYVETAFVPFEEAKYNKQVAAYIKSVGGLANAAGFGAEAWVSALFFRDAVKAVVAKDGVNGLTRENWLTAARSIHSFNADGMIGPEDVGGKVFGGCFDLLQVKGGKFVRVYPEEARNLRLQEDATSRPCTSTRAGSFGPMTTRTPASTRAAEVRAGVDHPIVDADGHFVEIGPLLNDEVLTSVEELGGPALRDRFLASGLAPTDTSSVLANRNMRYRCATSGARCRRGGGGRRATSSTGRRRTCRVCSTSGSTSSASTSPCCTRR